MIELSHFSFGYGKTKLFDNLNLSLKPGHIYGLLGMNGAGKSSLLKNLAGLASPWKGSCVVNNELAAKRTPSFLQDIFFIPEDIYLPRVTAEQFAKSTGHFYPKFNGQQYDQLLVDLDIPAGRLLTSLSLGQQKKAYIAFALATNTSVLIMDEPTNGLDIPSKVQFRKLVASVLTEERCVIISTHQVRDLDNLIDTVLILHNSHIILNQSLDDISEKLNFGTLPSSDTGYLYAEPHFAGLNAITQNTGENYTKVDLELLFNALVSHNDSLLQILNG